MACTPAPPGTSIADISDLSAISNNTTTRCCRVNFHPPAHLFHTTRKFGGVTRCIGWAPTPTQYEQQIASCQWTDVRHLHWRLLQSPPQLYQTVRPTTEDINMGQSTHTLPISKQVSSQTHALLAFQNGPTFFFTYRLVNVAENDKNSELSSATTRRHGVDQPNMSEPLAISITIL